MNEQSTACQEPKINKIHDNKSLKAIFNLKKTRTCSGIEKFWNSLVPASGRSYFYRPAINQDKQENPSNDFKETKQTTKK